MTRLLGCLTCVLNTYTSPRNLDSFKVNPTTEKGYKFKIRKFQRLLTVPYVPAAITFFCSFSSFG